MCLRQNIGRRRGDKTTTAAAAGRSCRIGGCFSNTPERAIAWMVVGDINLAGLIFAEGGDLKIGIEQLRSGPVAIDIRGCAPDLPGTKISVQIDAHKAGVRFTAVSISACNRTAGIMAVFDHGCGQVSVVAVGVRIEAMPPSIRRQP